MNKAFQMFVLCFQLFLVVGCGNKEIQSQTYITSIGIDYANGEFIVYTQALNFANIAKQEGVTSLQEAPPIFIGESKAKTIQAALEHLEQNAPLPYYYGHVNTILLSENVIDEKLKTVIEFIGQNPFLRYNIWLFGTKQDVKEILLGESFFNFPSMYTAIHNPNTLTRNTFFIPIKEYNHFISSFYQPVGSYIIPSIALNDETFSEGDTKKNIAAVTGGFAISQEKYKGWVNKEGLAGLKWSSNEAQNIPLSLFDEKVSTIIQKPKFIVEVLNGPKPAYRLMVDVKALLVQNEDIKSNHKIKIELEKKIRNDLLKTIEKSEEMQTDLLNIGETTYRYYLNNWDVRTINAMNKESIEKIDVNVQFVRSLNYKR